MFLANENFPRPSTVLLREAGIIVHSIQEDFPGISDKQVLEKASKGNQIILTFDKDYGELIFRHQIKEPPAVIFFREKGNSPLHAGKVLLSLIQTNELHFKNTFTVIEKENIRQRLYDK